MFRPDILDIEASGFGPSSYPIEIGYCLASGERFCMLIRPHGSWQHWDSEAESVHGIDRSVLHNVGIDLEQVCRQLNVRLEGRSLYSDAWVWDKSWLNRLFQCAGVEPSFRLHAIENIQSECQHLIWDDVRQQLLRERELVRHRASADALFVQRLYMRARQLCTNTAVET